MSDEATTQKTLKNLFGLTSFRPNQEAIISDILSGRDVLAIMATGGGKSLCYQMPAAIIGGLSIVISPLIALMKDQVDDLNRRGIRASLLTSSQTYDQRKAVEAELKRGEIRILYISPERMNLKSFQSLLTTLHPMLFAIDEAHCISQWGHQFRKDYRSLSIIRTLFPNTPIIALTATATDEVRKDIVSQLELRNPKHYVGGFDRENIMYRVIEEPKEEKRIQLLGEFLLKQKNKSGIIYCRSRKEAENIAQKLKSFHILALPYHAGLSANERSRVQDSFIQGDTKIVSATIAFGMGIDKPDVRFVVHFHPPKDLESFYQESGRAGRDGKLSTSLLFYSKQDFDFFQRLIEKECVNRDEQQIRMKKLSIMKRWCECTTCRRRDLLLFFGEVYPKAECDSCDTCISASRQNTDRLISDIASISGRYGVMTTIKILLGRSTKPQHHILPAFGTFCDIPSINLKARIEELLKDKQLEITSNNRLRVAGNGDRKR